MAEFAGEELGTPFFVGYNLVKEMMIYEQSSSKRIREGKVDGNT